MSLPVSKTQQAVSLFTQGDIKGALRLASSFRIGISKDDSKALKRGYESIIWPDQYRQLKKDPEQLQAEATRVFSRLFITEEE